MRQYDPAPRPKQDLEQLVSAVEELPFLSSSSQVEQTLGQAAGEQQSPPDPGPVQCNDGPAAVHGSYTALASHSTSSEAMKRGSWRDWSTLLHGLATAGMQCKNSPDLTRLCDQAVQLLPDKLALGAVGQDISMTLWAMAKLDYTGSAQPLLQSVTAAISQGGVMRDAKPQAWANLIWATSKLPDCREEARQLLDQFAARAQAVVTRSSVRSLAAEVAKADLAAFTTQAITNLLYARSMFLALSIHRAVSSGHSQLASEPQLNSMAAALWRECSRRGNGHVQWAGLEYTQLCAASQWLHACTGGQISLAASTALQQLVAKAAAFEISSIKKVQNAVRQLNCRQLVQALAAAGHQEPQQASLSQVGTFCALLRVGMELGLTRGISVDQTSHTMRDGSMSGVVAHVKLQQLTHFDAGVVVNKAVFDQLASDSERAAFMREQVRASLPEAEAWRQLLQAGGGHCAGQVEAPAAATPAAQQQQAVSVSAGHQARQQGALPLPAAQAKSAGALPSQRAGQAPGLMPRPVRFKCTRADATPCAAKGVSHDKRRCMVVSLTAATVHQSHETSSLEEVTLGRITRAVSDMTSLKLGSDEAVIRECDTPLRQYDPHPGPKQDMGELIIAMVKLPYLDNSTKVEQTSQLLWRSADWARQPENSIAHMTEFKSITVLKLLQGTAGEPWGGTAGNPPAPLKQFDACQLSMAAWSLGKLKPHLPAAAVTTRPGHCSGYGYQLGGHLRSPAPRTCLLPWLPIISSRTLSSSAHTLRQYDPAPRPKQDLEELVSAVKELPSLSSSIQVEQTSQLLWCFADWARQPENIRARMTQAECIAVMALLQHMAGDETAGDAPALPLLQHFNARQLSMSAWSLGKLKPHLPAAAVTSACTALASHSASSEAMKEGGWREWSNLLHGLATAGMQCSSSPDLTRLYDQAVQLLPVRLARGVASQNISMTLWAMAKSGYTGSAQPLLQSVTAAISQGKVMRDAKPQEWANLIWAASKLPGHREEARQLFEQFAIRGMRVVPALDAQNVSNILYAMGMFLWHDKEVCRQLAERAVLTQQSMKSQEISNSLYGLARLGYLDSSVRSLAAGVAKADLTVFENQHLANLLYARSMFLALSIHQAVSSGHSQLASEPQLNSMAAALWRECSRRGQGQGHRGGRALKQLYTASQWLHACTAGQISLATSPALQDLVAKAAAKKMESTVRVRLISLDDSDNDQLFQALANAGHSKVQQAVLSQNGTCCAQLLVLKPGLTRGISVEESPNFLQDGSMSGVVAHVKLQQLTHFDAAVVVDKAVFDQLASDSERAAFMREQVRASLPEAKLWRQLLQAALHQYDPAPRPKQDLQQLVSAVEKLPFLSSSSQVEQTSQLLWCFADWANQPENSRACMNGAQCNAVMKLLKHMAGKAGAGTAENLPAPLQQFDARQLSKAAWSLGKLRTHLPAAVTPACTALASHSASSKAMERGSWREWSTLLHGLATAGMQCSSSPDLTRLYDQAVQLLPVRLARGVASQNISMTLWAMAKSGYTGSAQTLLQSVTAAISQGGVMRDAKAQEWASLLWAASKLHGCREEARQLLDEFAIRGIRVVAGLDGQGVSNILFAMGMLLWLDKEVCRQLAERATQQTMNSQNMANSLYGLARLGYLDSSVRSLAAGVAKADLAAFTTQAITNLLYARSMFLALSIHQAVSSGHSQLASEPQLNSMAATLWRECSRRGHSEKLWGELDYTQLYTASRLLHACTGGQISLAASPALQALLATATNNGRKSITHLQSAYKRYDYQQLVQALEAAGHAEVQQAVISQDGTHCTQLLVWGPGLTRGISVEESPNFLPNGSMSGVVAHVKLQQLTHFDAGMVVNKTVFDQLASDSERAAFMREQVRASLPEAEAWRQLLQAEGGHCAGQVEAPAAAPPAAQQQQAVSVSAGQQARQQGALPLPAAQAKSAGVLPSQRAGQAPGLMPRPVRPRV
ncbi:hypothetical protein QJQ45_029993 [Haematococcus lacustris]|nr:hypothetical protein QJQ45_029993 [Haematococcus lacustris]